MEIKQIVVKAANYILKTKVNFLRNFFSNFPLLKNLNYDTFC